MVPLSSTARGLNCENMGRYASLMPLKVFLYNRELLSFFSHLQKVETGPLQLLGYQYRVTRPLLSP